MFEKAKGLFAKEEVYEEDPSEQPPKVDKYGIEGQGKQIDYESYLQYKRDFNDARTLNFSSSELYRKRIRERDAALLDTAFWATTASVTGWWLYRKANESENLRRFLHDLPLADLASTKLKKQFQDNLASGLIAEAIDPRSTAVPTVGHSLHSILTGLEELSPLQLMKTLQLSSFSSLFVDVIDQGYNEARHIKEGSIRAYEDFYKRMIKTEGGVDITNDDIARGFLLENNKLFKALPGEKEGQWVKGELLLDNARVVNTGVKTGENAVSTNRVFEKFANGYGFDVKRQMVEMEPLAIVGGKTKEGLVGNWIRAYGRFSAELGARSLDNPLGFIEEYANLTGKQGAIFASKPWKLMKKYANVQLGSGGVYNVTTTEMLKRTGKNLAIKGGAIGLGLAFADMAVESIAGESSAWNNGVISGIADTAMKAHIKFAEVWSDNFQGIRSAQENAASGSTNISSLLGITLAGAMAGANVAFFQRMFDNTRMGVDASSVKHLTEVKVGGVIGEVLEKVGQNKATSTLGRYSRVGALFGAVAALPFLPGAIVGKSSQELRDEYSGRTEVGVRDTRFWLAGSGSYEGGKIKYHRDNLLRVLATDADTKTLYGDRKTKRELNPILKPFAYLKNPYRFEEMHTHDAPMPVWGMDTSYGSFLGQVFKGTVGQLIKPTVVNPELQALQNALKSEEGAPMFNGKVKVLAKGVKALMRSEGSSGGVSGNGEEPTRYADGLMFDDETYATPEQEKKDVKSMIEDGWMLRKNAPTNEPYFRSFQGAWSGSEEFVGLKGFVGGLTISASGAHPVDQLRPELEISGSTTNASRALQDMALGDAMGCFLPGMPVLTSKGYKPIEDITVKDKVVSLDYRYRKVLDTHKRHYKDIEVLRVYIEGKLLPITCTPDHVFPMLSLKSLELTEKEIGSSSVGDYLFMLDKDSLNRCSIASYLRLKKPVNKSYKLSRITYIERFTYTGWVYDLSVAETPYYTVCNILCHNSGEFLRRLFPQSASSRRNTINPMRNLVAPEWLPSNDTKYYKNFSRGAVFSHNEMGTVLTPGTKGFEALNPELAGTDPNEIPLVYQYKVLQNIASNSPEHIAIKEHLIRNLEELSDKEKDVFFEAYGQDTAREELKRFDEYATGEEKGKMGLFAIHNAIWETFSHKENPLEPLLPFRPMAKFVHKRTAIEDYEKTQMMGPDTGIWTNPVSHFIRPAYNRTIKTINGGYVPEEYAEKNRVDKYFDKLALVKADKNGETYEAGRNITALAYVGVKDAEDMRKFKMAVSDEHRAYVEAFSREKDQDRRQKILEIVPEDIGRIYQSVWKNIDAYDYAIEKGIDPREYIDHLYLQDTAKLQQATKTRLKDVDKDRIEAEAFKDVDKGFFQKRKAEKMREAKAVRLRAAVKEAETYLENQTGSLPGDDWVGWDPRLKVDDLKLKTLTVGKEDIHKYGFWSTDLERLERLTVLDDHVKTMPRLEEVKREVRANAIEELRIRNKLREAGFETTRVTSSPSAKQTLTIKDTEEYLDNYYQR